MTMQAERLIGTRVTGSEGQAVGTVRHILSCADGTPAWACIKTERGARFVPLGGSLVTTDGLRVPYSEQRIMSGPEASAEQHISAAQADQLRRHFGATVPAQGGEPDAGAQAAEAPRGQFRHEEPRPGQDQRGEEGEEWVIVGTEQRADAGTERLAPGQARLRKYVDVEPVEQAVRVYHEEYEIQRVPITEHERIRGVISAGEHEIILFEEHLTFRRETVPVERVRLVVRRVEEDQILRDEVARERVQVEPDGNGHGPARQPAQAGQD